MTHSRSQSLDRLDANALHKRARLLSDTAHTLLLP
jgi:hypothetical protein